MCTVSQGTYAVVIVYCAWHNFWQRKWGYYIWTLNRHWKHSWPSQSTHLKSHQESKSGKRWFSTIFHQHKECTVTEYIYICNCTFLLGQFILLIKSCILTIMLVSSCSALNFFFWTISCLLEKPKFIIPYIRHIQLIWASPW